MITISKTRIKRKQFALGMLKLLIFSICLNILGSFIDKLPIGKLEFSIIDIFLIVLYSIAIYFLFILYVRRLHDIGRNGWISILALIPIVDVFFLIYLIFAQSDKNKNKYG